MVRRRRFVRYVLGSSLLALSGCSRSEKPVEETETTGELTESQNESTESPRTTTGTTSSGTTGKTPSERSSPATGSEASVDDVVVYNETNEEHRVELTITLVADASNQFTDEFTLGPDAEDSDTDSKAYPDLEQMDEKCRVEVTVDGERTASYDWEGDTKDYTGLQIHVDYDEITFTRKVV